MNLAYLRAHPEQLRMLLRHQRIRETPVTGGSICSARRLTLDDGTSVFVKSLGEATDQESPRTPPGFFEAEAYGLRWLGEAAQAGGAQVPEVIGTPAGMLVLEWVQPGEPTRAAAEEFGRSLARTHRAGAASFGAPWPGYIGLLPLDNTPGAGWPEWFAQRRLSPYLRLARDNGALTPADVAELEAIIADIDRYAPPPEPPARLHGDLWPGNLLWAAGDRAAHGRVVLVDPAAHGGHRETDLAQLALFGGAPYLDQILAAYNETWPLPGGWRDRVALHQLHLLLVHAALFGGAYRSAVLAAVRATAAKRAGSETGS